MHLNSLIDRIGSFESIARFRFTGLQEMNSEYQLAWRPLTLSFMGDFSMVHAQGESDAAEFQNGEFLFRVWYVLCRNSRLYDILFFCKAHCSAGMIAGCCVREFFGKISLG